MKERATIVCRRRDKILLVTRGRSHWALPGGTIQRAESSLEAARRELEEETALAVERFAYLFQFGGLCKRHHVFFVDLPDEAAPEPRNEILRCRWFRPKQISTLMTSVPTRQITELIFRHESVAIPSALPIAGM
jgi:8-oxo-dGTP diphosphatase